ncbi:AG2 protein OS=Streptomyces glaucescens OX=1907 GN=SGLAU_25395 PE=4 SV=1 [Streptomyces glaucescens]
MRSSAPEKALAFFGQLAMDTQEYSKVDEDRLKDVQELQKNLGLNLATASHDKQFTDKWGPELRKLGTEHIELSKYNSGGPFGYQLLGGIMRYGNYDAKFLNPIAEHVAQLHQKDPGLFAETKMVNSWIKNPYNPSGVNGPGYDPVTAMLEALGNSPEAAKKFLPTPRLRHADGTVTAEPQTTSGGQGRRRDQQLPRLLHQREVGVLPDGGSLRTRRKLRLHSATCPTPSATPWRQRPSVTGRGAGSRCRAGRGHRRGDAASRGEVQRGPDSAQGAPRGEGRSLGVMGAGSSPTSTGRRRGTTRTACSPRARTRTGASTSRTPRTGTGRAASSGASSHLGQHRTRLRRSRPRSRSTRSVLEGAVGPDGKITDEVEGWAWAAVRVGQADVDEEGPALTIRM